MREEFERISHSITFFSNHRISRKFRAFAQVIREIDPDLVHVQGHEGMFAMLLWLKLLGLPVINTFHSTHFDEIGHFARMKETLAQFCVDKIVHVSRETERRYSRAFWTMPGKHTTIYNGVDAAGLARRLRRGRLPGWETGVHVLSVANFHPQKGYATGLPVLARLCERFPRLTCHIVGGAHGADTTERWVRSYVERHGLRNRVILHGEQADVAPFLASADIFFSPSDKELMPVSILEALAAELPVVATRTGGVPEILGEQGEWGRLCDVGDAAGMEAELARLILDADARARLACAARTRIRAFDISVIRAQYIALYQAFLPPPPFAAQPSWPKASAKGQEQA